MEILKPSGNGWTTSPQTFEEVVRARGRVRATLSRKGIPEAVFDLGPNLVVDLGRAASAKLLGGRSLNPQGDNEANGGVVRFISLGSGIASESANDAGLEPEYALSVSAIDAVQFPLADSTSVAFVHLYEESEMNGVDITEAGLWTGPDLNNRVLYARKIFGLINKTVDFTLEFYWEILF